MSTTASRAGKFRYPWRDGNAFELLVDGSNFLPRMLAAIRSARQQVLLEMYLVESGSVLDRFITAVTAAARRDVRCYLLLDDFGAIGLSQKDRDRLSHENVQIAYYNKLHSHSTLSNIFRIFLLRQERSLHRNHRKLLLVDQDTAFVGGTGLVDAFDPPKHPERRWRETMVRIRGPVVADWAHLFVSSWNKTTSEVLPLPASAVSAHAGSQRGRLTVNDIEQYSEILSSLIGQVAHAKQRVWFATAYFVPRWRIRRSLKRAAKAGADVRLLLPGPITDHPGVRYVSQRLYGRLLRNGVRIFEYQPRFFHAKTVLCDNWVAIGSSNFDRWNLRWNLEANQEIDDDRLASQVMTMFQQDFSNSLEFSYQRWRQTSLHKRLLRWFWKRVEVLSQKIGR